MQSLTAADLVHLTSEHPPTPIIEDLLDEGDIMLIHGAEQSFKSLFEFQIAESVAKATPLLRLWSVPRPRKVGVIATTMQSLELGKRLSKMFANREPPDNIQFLPYKPIGWWEGKLIRGWIEKQAIEVSMFDIANDCIEAAKRDSLYLRRKSRLLNEDVVAEFFAVLRRLPVQARLVVLQDRQRKLEKVPDWREQPDVILCLKRIQRTNEVRLQIEKLHRGNLDTITLWFDQICFRLTPLPPVIAVLENGPRPLAELMADLRRRFGIDSNTAGKILKPQKPYLTESPKEFYEIDWARAVEAPWHRFLVNPAGGHSDLSIT